jgi:alkyl hydroperoxide reductase subunit AhpC
VTVQLGDIAPDFEQDTLNGSIRFHEWMGRSWCILFSQPSESTKTGITGASPLAQMARLKPEWNRRGVKVVGLSVPPSPGNDGAGNDGHDVDGWTLNFPVVSDADRMVSTLYGMSDAAGETIERRVYVIDPDKRVRLVRTYREDCGRDFTEMLQVVDGMRLADGKEGTP